jgi:antitoxin CptB
MTMDTPSLRKLIYQSWHRGTRELDLILGHFIEAQGPTFTPQESTLYAELLQYEDPLLYNWISVNSAKAPPLLIDMVKRIQAFYQVS